MGDDPMGWVWFVLTEAIPYLLVQAGKAFGEIFVRDPLLTVVGVLATLGVWKLLETAVWAVSKAWFVIVLAAAGGIAGVAVLMLVAAAL